MSQLIIELPTLVQHAPDLDVSSCSWNISILTRSNPSLDLYRITEDIIAPLDSTQDLLHPCRPVTGDKNAEPRLYSFHLPSSNSVTSLPIVMKVLLLKQNSSSTLFSVLSEVEENIELGVQPFTCGTASKLSLQFKDCKQDPHSTILIAELGLTFEPFLGTLFNHPLVHVSKRLSLVNPQNKRLENSRRINVSISGFNINNRDRSVDAANTLFLLNSTLSNSHHVESTSRFSSSSAVLAMLGDPLRRLEVRCSLSRASGDLLCDPVSLGFATITESASTAVFGSTSGGGTNETNSPSGWSIELATSATLSIPVTNNNLGKKLKGNLSLVQETTDNNDNTDSDFESLDFIDQGNSSPLINTNDDISDIHLLFYMLSYPSSSSNIRKESGIGKLSTSSSSTSSSTRPTCVAFSYLRIFDDKGHILCDPKSESLLNSSSLGVQSSSHLVALDDGAIAVSAPLILYPGSPPFLPADPLTNNEAIFTPSQASRLVTSDIAILPQHQLPRDFTTQRVPPHLRLLEASTTALAPFQFPDNKTPSQKQNSTRAMPVISSSFQQSRVNLQQVRVEDSPRAQALGLFPSILRVSIILVDSVSTDFCIGDAMLRRILASTYKAEIEDKELANSSSIKAKGKAQSDNEASLSHTSSSSSSFIANTNLRTLIASASIGQINLSPGQFESSRHGWKAISCVIRVHLAAIVALRSFDYRRQLRKTRNIPFGTNITSQIDYEEAALTGLLPGTFQQGSSALRDTTLFTHLIQSIGVPSEHLPPMCSESIISQNEESVTSDKNDDDDNDNNKLMSKADDDLFLEKQAEVAAGGLRILLRIISCSFTAGDEFQSTSHSLSLFSEKKIFGQVLASTVGSVGLFEAGFLPPGPFSTCLLMCRIASSSYLSSIKSNKLYSISARLDLLSNWLLDWSGLVCSALSHAIRTGQLFSIRVDDDVIAAAVALDPVLLYPIRQGQQGSEEESTTSTSPFLHAVHSFRSLLLTVLDSIESISQLTLSNIEKDLFTTSIATVVQRVCVTASTEGFLTTPKVKRLAISFSWVQQLISRIVSVLVITPSNTFESVVSRFGQDNSSSEKQRLPHKVLSSLTTPQQQVQTIANLKTPINARTTMSIIDKYKTVTGRVTTLTSQTRSEISSGISMQNTSSTPLQQRSNSHTETTSGTLISKRLRAGSSTMSQQPLSGSIITTKSDLQQGNKVFQYSLLFYKESISFQSSNNLLSESIAVSCSQSMLKDGMYIGSDVLSLKSRASLLNMCGFLFTLLARSDIIKMSVLSSVTIQHLVCLVAAEILHLKSALIRPATIACAALCSLVEQKGCFAGTEYLLAALFQSAAISSVDAVNTMSTFSTARSSRLLLLALRLSRAFETTSGLALATDIDKRCFSKAVQVVLPSVGSQRIATLDMSAATLRCIQSLILKSSGSWSVRTRWPTIHRLSLRRSNRSIANIDEAEDSPADGFSCMMWAIHDACLFSNKSNEDIEMEKKMMITMTTLMAEEEKVDLLQFPIPALSSTLVSLISKPLLLSVLPLIDSIDFNNSSPHSNKDISGFIHLQEFQAFLLTLHDSCTSATYVSLRESRKKTSNSTMIESSTNLSLDVACHGVGKGKSLLSSLISALTSSLSTSSLSLKRESSTIDALWLAVLCALTNATSTVVKTALATITSLPFVQQPEPIPTQLLLESIRLLTTIISALFGRAFFEGMHSTSRSSPDLSWSPNNVITFLIKSLTSLKDAEAQIEENRPDYAECCDTLLFGKEGIRPVALDSKIKKSKTGSTSSSVIGPNSPSPQHFQSTNKNKTHKSYTVISTIISRVAIQWTGSALVSIFSREGSDSLYRTKRPSKTRKSKGSLSLPVPSPSIFIQGCEETIQFISAVLLSSAASNVLRSTWTTQREPVLRLSLIGEKLCCLALNRIILPDIFAASILQSALNTISESSVSTFKTLSNQLITHLGEAVRDLYDTTVYLGDVYSAYGFASLAVAVCGDARNHKSDLIGTELEEPDEKIIMTPNGLAWPHSVLSPGASDHASCSSDSLHAPIDSLPLAHALAQKARALVVVLRAEERNARYSPVAFRGNAIPAGLLDDEFVSTRCFFCIQRNPMIYLFPWLSQFSAMSNLPQSESRPPQPLSQLLSSKNIVLLATAREVHLLFAIAFGACLAAREYELALDMSSISYAELVRVLSKMQISESNALAISSTISIDNSNENVGNSVYDERKLQTPRVTFDIQDDATFGSSLKSRTNQAGTVRMSSNSIFTGIVQSNKNNPPQQELVGENAILARAVGLLLRDCAAGGEATAHFSHGSLPSETVRRSWETMTSSPSLRGRRARLSAGPGRHSFCSSLVSFSYTIRNGKPPRVIPNYAAIGFCTFTPSNEENEQFNHSKESSIASSFYQSSPLFPPKIEWRLTRLPMDTSLSDFAIEIQKSNPNASIFGPDSVFLINREKNSSFSFYGTGAIASKVLSHTTTTEQTHYEKVLKSQEILSHIYILPAFPSKSIHSSIKLRERESDTETDIETDIESVLEDSVSNYSATNDSTFSSSFAMQSLFSETTPFPKDKKHGHVYSTSHSHVFEAPFCRRGLLSSIGTSSDLLRSGVGVLLHSGGFKLHSVEPDKLIDNGQSSGVTLLRLQLSESISDSNTDSYEIEKDLPCNFLPWTTRLARVKASPHIIEVSLVDACAKWAIFAKKMLQSRIDWASSVYLESFVPASSTSPAPPIFAPTPTSASVALALLPPSLPETGMPDDSFFDTHYEKGGQGCGSLPTPLVQALLSGRYSLDLNPPPITIPTKSSAQLVSVSTPIQRQHILTHLMKKLDQFEVNNTVSSHSITAATLPEPSSEKDRVVSAVSALEDVENDVIEKNDDDDISESDEEDKTKKAIELEEDDNEKKSVVSNIDINEADNDVSVKRSLSLHSIKSITNKSSSSSYHSVHDTNKTLVQSQNEELEEKDEGGIILDSIYGGQDVAKDLQKDSFLKVQGSRSRSSSLSLIPMFGGLGSVSSSSIRTNGENEWRDRTYSVSSIASSLRDDTYTIASIYDEDDDEENNKNENIQEEELLLSNIPPHVPYRLYQLPRLTLSQTFALLLDDLTTGIPPFLSTGSRRSGGLPVASLVISPQRSDYSESPMKDILLLIDMSKRALYKYKQESIIKKEEEEKGKEKVLQTVNSSLIIPLKSDYRPGLDASAVAMRLRGLAGSSTVPLFPSILPPLVQPKLPPFPEQVFPPPEEGGAPVGQAIVPAWLVCLVLSAGVSTFVHPTWSSVCGLSSARQALHDYSELKVIEREKATTELRREFCRWEESERAAGRGDDVDAYPIPDWPNAIPRVIHSAIPLLEVSVNESIAALALSSMFVLPNVATTLAIPSSGNLSTASTSNPSIGGKNTSTTSTISTSGGGAGALSVSVLNSSIGNTNGGDSNKEIDAQHQLVHRSVLTTITRNTTDFDELFEK